MRIFKNEGEAKKYAARMDKYTWEIAALEDGREVILCPDCRSYEDKVWTSIFNIAMNFFTEFGEPEEGNKAAWDEDDIVDAVSKLRDFVISLFEKRTGRKFLCGSDNF